MDSSKIQSVKQQFGIIGNDPELLRAIDTAIQVAHTDLTVLITGESGVGKEYFPQIIHQNSVRKHAKYFAVNCGAIPEGTIDSELFGHVKGAFTDAVSERKGYFSEADGGTIFLDEVGELPMATQARLLRVLENGEFLRVGSSKVEKTNVRIVCATNVNLPEAISEGRFREDLYYRLNTVPINVPPLRKRGEDVVLLFKKFALDFAAKYAVPKIQLGESAKSAILEYPWPGNIRQLKNVAEQISLLEMQREITGETMKKYLPQQTQVNLPARLSSPSTKGKTFESEREILYSVLFDMRRDITELKAQVEELTMGRSRKEEMPLYATAHEISMPQGQMHPTTIHLSPIKEEHEPVQRGIIESEEYVEETLSLDDMERMAILRALERHRGKRREAAKELNISERTLYRKIKEYGLD
ncbi:MAG: sigma-54-dependent Fis family transcriptional regulator [Bacteroidaceae bacterium]|nr:sigma-54-dependent Fis family transcriptional regulator [Bacteroidaceae bacterium]MBQ5816846.1 sigma-54-dependent Fis family transcriptional regulator [Bacteroidaceae bacterium]